MQKCEYNAQMISDAMQGSTGLKSLKLSLDRWPSVSNIAAFEHTLCTPFDDEARKRPLGVIQVENLLFGVLKNNLEIEELHFGWIHWLFFREDDERFARYKLAVRHLKKN